MAKISEFIIMLVVFVMVFAGGFGYLMMSLNNEYSPSGYNESEVEVYNKLADLYEDSEEIQNKSMELQSKSGVLDVLGGFFESAYDTIKVSVGSFSIFDSMKNSAMEELPIDDTRGIYTAGITIIVIIAVFLGIIISTVTKRET